MSCVALLMVSTRSHSLRSQDLLNQRSSHHEGAVDGGEGAANAREGADDEGEGAINARVGAVDDGDEGAVNRR